MTAPLITLTGGPWNGTRIPDLDKVVIRIGIATAWENGRPKVGALVGNAIYEPGPDRARAFFVGNEWDGVCAAIIPADESIEGEEWKL